MRILTKVVFPAPLGPRRPSTVPSSAVRSTPARATVAPKRLPTPCTSIIEPVMCAPLQLASSG